MRYRTVAAVIFVMAVVGAKAALGSAASDTAAAVATPLTRLSTATAQPTDPWEISGKIQQMNGEFWEIDGFAIRVTASTQVTGDVPSNGVFVRARGSLDSDGTWQARQVWVGSATTPTVIATRVGTAATISGTPWVSPTPTPTVAVPPTSTPTVATSTPRPAPPTATATSRPSSTVRPSTGIAPTRPAPAPNPRPGHKKKG